MVNLRIFYYKFILVKNSICIQYNMSKKRDFKFGSYGLIFGFFMYEKNFYETKIIYTSYLF
jgi:hypothetical protein